MEQTIDEGFDFERERFEVDMKGLRGFYDTKVY
jgi:hypothetical protein